MVRSAEHQEGGEDDDVQHAGAPLLGIDQPLLAEPEAEQRAHPLAGPIAAVSRRSASRGTTRRVMVNAKAAAAMMRSRAVRAGFMTRERYLGPARDTASDP